MTEEKVFVLGIVGGAILALALLFYIPYRMICAWCKKDLGPIRKVYEDSHGICDECGEKWLGVKGKES